MQMATGRDIFFCAMGQTIPLRWIGLKIGNGSEYRIEIWSSAVRSVPEVDLKPAHRDYRKSNFTRLWSVSHKGISSSV